MTRKEPYGFVLVLHRIREACLDQKTNNRAARIMAILTSYAGQDGKIKYFSIQKTAKEMGVSRAAIQRQINILIEKKYIERELRNGQTSKYSLRMKGVTKWRSTPSAKEDATSDVARGDTLEGAGGETQLGYTKRRLEIKKKTHSLHKKPEQTWHKKIKCLVESQEYECWLRKLSYNSDRNQLEATQKVVLKYVNNNLRWAIERVLGDVEIVLNKKQGRLR